jgi:hypothetical protein
MEIKYRIFRIKYDDYDDEYVLEPFLHKDNTFNTEEECYAQISHYGFPNHKYTVLKYITIDSSKEFP